MQGWAARTGDAVEHAALAAKSISGGLFDIAEIYDSKGLKVAESLTREGAAVESLLPHHGKPGYTVASYDSFELPGKLWVLRIFVPLRRSATDTSGAITGYFEGVRIVPKWEEEQIFASSLAVALMVCLASLLCGAALYPVVVHLSTENERKTRELLESQSALIEGLQRSERELEEKVTQRTLELQHEQVLTKELLHNILPVEIADELSATGSARPAPAQPPPDLRPPPGLLSSPPRLLLPARTWRPLPATAFRTPAVFFFFKKSLL